MKWSSKKKFEYLCTGSGTKENFSVLTGINVVQTISIFVILKFGGGGSTEMVLNKNTLFTKFLARKIGNPLDD